MKTTSLVPTGEVCHCEPPLAFPRSDAAPWRGCGRTRGHAVRTRQHSTLMAIAVVVAVSVVSLVVLVAVLGRGARHRAALTVLSVCLVAASVQVLVR